MRRAISIILAATLITTPIKVVLAQAGQQESQVTATDIPSVVTPRTDQTPARIGVPVVEPNNGSALLFTVGLRDNTVARDVLTLSPPYRQSSTTRNVVLLVVGLLVALVVIVTLACAGPACD